MRQQSSVQSFLCSYEKYNEKDAEKNRKGMEPFEEMVYDLNLEIQGLIEVRTSAQILFKRARPT